MISGQATSAGQGCGQLHANLETEAYGESLRRCETPRELYSFLSTKLRAESPVQDWRKCECRAECSAHRPRCSLVLHAKKRYPDSRCMSSRHICWLALTELTECRLRRQAITSAAGGKAFQNETPSFDHISHRNEYNDWVSV